MKVFRLLRHILTPLWACKAKKCHFSRKFDLWPDLTRSNNDLGLKTICAIARSRRGASTGFFREALRPSGADRQGGGAVPTPAPLTVRVMRNALTGRGLTLAGTGHFASFHGTGGWYDPRAISPLIELELRGKKWTCSPPRDEASGMQT